MTKRTTEGTRQMDTRQATPREQPVHTKLIRKVLVANRGEIASRIIRTCRDMGIATVAVFSDADASAPYVREAGEAIRLGESAASASYLNSAKLLDAAQRTGADAVHPGYGFLAENAEFASACRRAGLAFIGPQPEVIEQMGSKREAKLRMAAAGVPVVPGYQGEDQSDDRFLAAARELGLPVMVKASAGGGGKGMRVVEHEADMPGALAGARREARSAFGDDTLILEKAIAAPRHIEFQIFGDLHGNIIHLGERECTIQRRHQKIVEETPSTALSPELRVRMGEAAITVGRALGYSNAGTVEFILDSDGSFYFLEVNTRLQVEHPVTEMVTGLDLVRWQILVEEGHPLPWRQDEVLFTGHAVEVRVYAEDPANSFLPATGTIALWRPPAGNGVRCDDGIATGSAVSPYYDPMLAKISAHGTDRAEALRRLDAALAGTTLFGVRNNLDFLRRILLHPAHLAGKLSTAFIQRYADDLFVPPSNDRDDLTSSRLAALVAALQRQLATSDPLRWRNNPNRPVVEHFDALGDHSGDGASASCEIEVRLTPLGRDAFAASLTLPEGERRLDVRVCERAGPDLTLELDGHRIHTVAVEAGGGTWWVRVGTATHTLHWCAPLPVPGWRSAAGGSLAAPMPGQVIAVLVREGQPVAAGDPLLILEAMKMEHTVRSPRDGVVTAVRYHAGEQVPAGAELAQVHVPGTGEL